MNIATLKVYGDEHTLDDVRDGLPTEPESTWRKGDARPDGRVRIDSGFIVNLGQDENPDALLRHLRAWLHECEARGITFDVAPIAACSTVDKAGGRCSGWRSAVPSSSCWAGGSRDCGGARTQDGDEFR